MFCRTGFCFGLFVGVLAPLAAARAATNEPPPAQQAATTLKEIVVNAQRREQRLLDVPVAVTAISGAELRKAKIEDVKQLAAVVPSLVVFSGFSGENDINIGLRGLVITSPLANIDPAVGVQVDGVYYAHSMGTNIALVDLQGVEVLSGPQGTLFGRNTIGGTVNFTTQAPSYAFGGSFQAEFGNYDENKETVVVNAPLIQDRVAARLVYQHSEHSGYVHNDYLNTDLSNADDNYFRVSLLADLTDKLRVLQTVDYYTGRANSTGWVLADFDPVLAAAAKTPASLANYLSPNGRTSFGGINPRNRQSFFDYTAHIDWDLGWATLKSITGYRRLDFNVGADSDATPLVLVDIIDEPFVGWQFSQEVTINGDGLGQRLKWIGGIYYFQESLYNGTILEQIVANSSTLSNNQDIRNKSASAFGQVSFEITPRLTATLGARYVEDYRGITYIEPRTGAIAAVASQGPCLLTTIGLPVSPNNCQFTPPEIKFHYVPWTAGLDYKPSRGWLVYGKVSEGYRSGGFQQAGSANEFAQVTPFAPESLLSYEAGVKTLLLRDRLRLTADVYHSNYDNIQQGVPSIPPGSSTAVNFVLNAGKATVDGAEFDVDAILGKLELRGTLGLTDFKFTSGPFVGGTQLYSPKTTYFLSADYPVELPLGQLTLHADYAYQSTILEQNNLNVAVSPPVFYPATEIGWITQKGYGLLGARASLPIKGTGLTVSIWGKNLTNQYYKTRVQSIYTKGYESVIPGLPRIYGATLAYAF